ncbi:MAG TPA: sigma-70 family RNA polymerase sigma factor [Candidatus Angelobacter sp.]|nr:sigma-70 family RNA polymerase sigma factor [Candidatus Angelobacter sp.]
MKKQGAYAEQQHNGNVAVLDPQRASNGWKKHPQRANGEVYLSAISVDLYQFDDSYMELLRRRDRSTQEHFAVYFGKLLRIKLRSRKLPAQVIQDVQQETFMRVLNAVRTGEVRQPDRLGPYVNSVCNNILLEEYRQLAREQHTDLDGVDVIDAAADLEAQMIGDERTQRVHAIMNQLSRRDKAVLQAILLERDKDDLCQELKVDRGYLRVLTHRAIGTFRDQYESKGKKGPDGMSRAAKR